MALGAWAEVGAAVAAVPVPMCCGVERACRVSVGLDQTQDKGGGWSQEPRQARCWCVTSGSWGQTAFHADGGGGGDGDHDWVLPARRWTRQGHQASSQRTRCSLGRGVPAWPQEVSRTGGGTEAMSTPCGASGPTTSRWAGPFHHGCCAQALGGGWPHSGLLGNLNRPQKNPSTANPKEQGRLWRCSWGPSLPYPTPPSQCSLLLS